MSKRILIISHNPFSSISNNGKTLEAIFSKFEKEEIYQLYFVDDEYIDLNYANSYYSILDRELISSSKKENNNESLERNVEPKPESSFISSIKKYNHSLAIFRDLLWKVRKPEKKIEFVQWLEHINPDFVFFVGANQSFAYNITNFVVSKLKVKYAVFFTDDYIIYPQKNNILKFIQNKILLKKYKSIIANASLCFAIGEKMCQEYSLFFNKQFQPIMNMADVSKEIIKTTSNDKFVISYFGGLHLERWKMLCEFSDNIDRQKVVLQVYTTAKITDEINKCFKKTGIIYKGGVSGKDLTNAIANSDALIHIESNDVKYQSLTKLSVSTKIPEYLNTNKLVIAYGPKNIASIELISKNNVGLVITEKRNIKKEIDNIINDRALIQKFSDNARKYVKENFDINKNSEEFKKLIEATIDES